VTAAVMLASRQAPDLIAGHWLLLQRLGAVHIQAGLATEVAHQAAERALARDARMHPIRQVALG